MTIDDVMQYISKLKVECWQGMQDNITDDDKWMKHRGAYDVLEKMAHYILLKTNPHNRADIKKFNEKQEKKDSDNFAQKVSKDEKYTYTMIEAAKAIGISRAMLYKSFKNNTGPKLTKIGRRSVILRPDLFEWFDSLRNKK